MADIKANMDIRFPEALAKQPNWVCWKAVQDTRSGKIRKVPMNAVNGQAASATDPATWCGVEEALAGCKKYLFLGVGFVFTPKTGLIGVDIDHCIDPSTHALNDTARAIYDRCPTYTEYSPSGTGLHLFYFGKMPGKGNKNSVTGVEMYGDTRYFTMTGKRFEGCPDAPAEGGDALQWIHETYVAKKPKEKKRSSSAKPMKLNDDVLLEKARSAQNGELFTALWENQWQGLIETDENGEPVLDDKGVPKKKYASQSEADMALCCMLAFWTGKNREQIDRLFRQSGLFRPKWDEAHFSGGETYGGRTLDDALKATESVYSPDGEPVIFEHNGRYFRVKGEQVYPITNFTVRPLDMIVSDDEAQLSCDLVNMQGETFRQTFMTTDFSNLQKFKGVINRCTIALSYTGSENDLEILKGYLAGMEWTKKHGVKALGIYERDKRWVFVARDSAFASGGESVKDVVQLEKYASIESTLPEAAAITAEKLVELGPLLLDYNEPAKTVSVLAWCAGCFLKEHLRKAGVKYPHLFLIGEAGSGKSNTLERVILPIFGRSKVVAAPQVTAFTLMKDSASSNLIPQALDEFKPSKIDRLRLQALYNHFRDSYDGHEGLRGRADQSQISYALLAPMVVAGEESADEVAIRERSVELLFSKRDLKDEAARAAFFQLSTMMDTVTGLGRALLNTALTIHAKDVGAWHKDAMNTLGSSMPSRVVNNLACCVVGLRHMEMLCKNLGLDWEYVFPISMDACVRYLVIATREYLLDGGETNKSVVEQTLEVMDRMGLSAYNCRMMENGHIAIHFKSAYDLFTKYRRDYAIVGECLTYPAFMRQLRKSDLYVEDKPVRFEGELRKATVLNYAILKQRCDVAGFMNTEVEALNGVTCYHDT